MKSEYFINTRLRSESVSMKEIPDFDIELSQATDYILGCPLAKRAFCRPPFYNFTNIVTDIISASYLQHCKTCVRVGRK